MFANAAVSLWSRRVVWASLVAIAASGLSGCDREPLSVHFVPPDFSGAPAAVRVSGLTSAELRAIAPHITDESAMSAMLSVSVEAPAAAPDPRPVTGTYAIDDDALLFRPRAPFAAGRGYSAVFSPARMPRPRDLPPLGVDLTLPAPATPVVSVLRMLPSAEVLPENLLRVYLDFSVPMARDEPFGHLELLDDRGVEVTNAFVPVTRDAWSADGRRLTVRLATGAGPGNAHPSGAHAGHALVPGGRFTLVVDRAWRDANGRPLTAEFRHIFRVGPADTTPVRPAAWSIAPPAAGTTGAVIVRFPKPLDDAALRRALGVAAADGTPMAGEIAIGENEQEWRFTPRRPWRAGAYVLNVLSSLEDPMGNRIRRPSERRLAMPFTIR